jgi:exosortase
MTQQAAATSMPFVRRFSIRAVYIVALFVLLWISLWHQLSGEWSVNDQYSYGWFVPLFAVILFWLRYEDRPQESEKEKVASRKQLVAIATAIVALVFLFPIRLFEIGNPDWRPLSWLHAFCVIAITLAFLWSVGGAPWLRHFAFPVLFALVAVPWISLIEAPIIQGLMRIIAAFAAETANLLGIPAQVQGNLIQVRTGLIGVNEACSGVRSLQTSIMIGLLFGELKRLSILRRVALILGAIAIALVANLARAVVLVCVGAEEGTSAVERWHDIAGYGIVVLVFVGSIILAAILGRRKLEITQAKVENEKESTEREAKSGAWRSSFLISNFFFLFCALTWVLLVEVSAHGWYRAHEKNEVAMPRWTVHWPNDSAGFRESKIDEGVRSTLRYDDAKQAAWNLRLAKPETPSGEQPTLVRCLSFFFRWNPGGSSVVRARAHRPDICLPAAGWRQISDLGLKNYPVSENLTLPFHHLVFADERGGMMAHTFFCLQEDELKPNEPRPDLEISGGAQPDWGLAGRSRVVLNGARNRGQQILEVVLISSRELDNGAVEKEFAAMIPGMIAAK